MDGVGGGGVDERHPLRAARELNHKIVHIFKRKVYMALKIYNCEICFPTKPYQATVKDSVM